MRDLHEEKDGGWMRLYPERSERIALGEVGVRGTGEDLAIVTFANGFYLSCQAQAELERAGIATRVIDMRWLSPLPKPALTEAVKGARHILVGDGARNHGAVAEAFMAHFHEPSAVPLARLPAEEQFTTTGREGES